MRAILAAMLLCLCAGAHAQTGIASIYSYGRVTASGERFDPHGLTAAHRTLPFGTLVKVCRVGGNCIVARINDRGPFVRGRIIDLTPAGARALGFSGLARVTVEPLGWTPRHGDFGSF
jgi:rare lipoprotein A